MVYFIQAVGGQGPIKVGYAFRVDQRMDSLQRMSPVRLIVLAAVEKTMGDERRLHELLAEHRLYGEWFAPCEGLLELIAVARGHTAPEWLDYQIPLKTAKQRTWKPGAKYRQMRKVDSRLPNYFALGVDEEASGVQET